VAPAACRREARPLGAHGGQRFLQHQQPDDTQEHHVDEVDGDIDLADGLEPGEDQLSQSGPEDAAYGQDHPHLHIDLSPLPIG